MRLVGRGGRASEVRVFAARIMLGFGTGVEVLSPPGVRADHAAVAAVVVARYASDSNMRLDVR